MYIKMKKLTYLLFASVMILTGCAEDYVLEDRDLSVIELPPYVAFSAPGANATINSIETSEAGGTFELNVEVPGGTISDVTVNYIFGGNAEFGVDFTIVGATSAGGSLFIEHIQSTNPNDAFADNADIVVQLLTDDVTDGVKTLDVILDSASNADGALAVGRGGTDFLKTSTIIIADIDCGFATGTYDVLGTILVDDFGSGPYTYTDRLSLADCAVDGVYQISDISGGLYTNAYATSYGTSPATAVLNFASTGGAVTWTGVSDQFGGQIIEDPLATTTSNYDAANGIITIYWTATAFGERGITVYTIQ